MAEEKKEVGYVFNIGAATDDGISMQITGNLPLGVTMDIANAELDKWSEAFSRQRAKAILAKEEETLLKERAALARLHEQFDEQNKKEDLRAAEKRNLDSIRQNINSVAATIAAREMGIESLKKLI